MNRGRGRPHGGAISLGAKRRCSALAVCFPALLSERVPLEREFVRVMHQSVKDGVAQGGVPDDLVPLLDGELAGDQGGAQAVAVLQDFEDVTALLFGEVGQSPVIDDEQVEAGVGSENLPVASVGLGHGEVVEEPGSAQIEGAVTFPAGFVGQGAREVALAHAGRAGDDDVLLFANPLASGQAQYEGFVESARMAEVHVLDGGGQAQFGLLEPQP